MRKPNKKGSPHVFLFVVYSVGAIHESPAISNRYREINTLYVILSGENRLRFAESKFCEVINGAKPRSECDDGIWLGAWVAFESM